MAFGSITGFFNKYLVGFGLGQAAGPALEPYVQDLVNAAWASNPEKPVQYALAAEAAAQRIQGDGADAGEAASQGLTGAKFDTLVKMFETAPGEAVLLELLRRKLISEADLQHGHEKHTLEDRWMAPLAALKDRVLSAETWAMLRLKGWKTEGEAAAGGALQGYSADLMQDMYLSMGRPAAPQQMATAIARGAPGPEGGTMDEAQFLKGIQESDIRPEWGPMLYAIRYAYPPLFQINRLVQAGAISTADATAWAVNDRYAPEVVAALAKYWGGAATGGGKELTAAEAQAEYEGGFMSEGELRTILQQLGYAQAAIDQLVHLGDARRVAAVRGQAITAIGKVYLAHEIGAGQATTALAGVGVGDQAAGDIIGVWNIELGLARRLLTPAQIVSAYKRAVLTQGAALTALEDRGYTAADAQTLLATAHVALTDKEVQNAYQAGTITLAQAETYLAQSGHTPDEIDVLLSGIKPNPPAAP